MTPAQCRAARGLLDWTQQDLAKVSEVSLTTVRNFERGARQPIRANLAALRTAFEAAGIVFVEANGGGIGVRLKD
ncbi:helix-turn-helix transcriptional regulator [Pelagibius litoralis]|uniref:Helix-turn-helix transcriptional regulator n=1 Tax=Pelagibius litoralis TaxID=374515 RepID=A0A967KCY1_9PROT|nr:helix-turn-helix transcriptional regulator [Pelagibius litoralis]NIA71114.1 helix-turn-helix transcriptional regulator [Pelagibius litoralis]